LTDLWAIEDELTLKKEGFGAQIIVAGLVARRVEPPIAFRATKFTTQMLYYYFYEQIV
jgi:hypothetical protein